VRSDLASPQSVPLWQQLQATAAVIRRVAQGESGRTAIESVSAALRPGVQALAFHAWRNAGRAHALLDLLVAKKPQPQVRALLELALALIWQAQGAPYDGHTLVNQTVEAAKRQVSTKAQAGFINACLRRFLRDRVSLLEATEQNLSAVWNHPDWWIRRLQRQYPQQWSAILQASNQPAPLTLRVNQRKTTTGDYLLRLQELGLAASQVGASALVLHQAVPVQHIPGFADGEVSVQDAAAQRAAELLLAGTHHTAAARILDACAAPGGKTAHLLEMTDAAVWALEVDPQRCQRIDSTLARLGLQAKVVCADAALPAQWWDGVLFDAILLDAPCSASGIVRRHPDVRWLRRESDIAQLAQTQQRLLNALWPLLKPGGRLLYCTCSVFQEEGLRQTEMFLAHNTQAVLEPSLGHCLPETEADGMALSDNRVHHDGFYFALFRKLS
jgi:16S rRNA (cytosine967-C5)-methyltransferase